MISNLRINIHQPQDSADKAQTHMTALFIAFNGVTAITTVAWIPCSSDIDFDVRILEVRGSAQLILCSPPAGQARLI